MLFPMPSFRLFAAILALFALLPGAARAQYTSLSVFGDSLADTGNLNLLTGGTQPPSSQPYFGGVFSDGLPWTARLAIQLGSSAGQVASLAGGTNYAWAGARLAVGTAPSITSQIRGTGAGFWGSASVDPTGLYVIVAGMNDMRAARSSFPTDSVADRAGRQAAADSAAATLIDLLGTLASRGAHHVLLASLPDLGFTPEAAGLILVTASTDASTRFNAELPAILEAGRALGLDMMFVDLAGAMTAIRTDALSNGGATYGLTNAQSPCAGFNGSNGSPCNVSVYSDALHPSAAVHALFAQRAAIAVPEPGGLTGLTGLMAGMIGLGWAERRRALAAARRGLSPERSREA